MLHEFAHLMDYCYGNLSTKSDFVSIRDSYECYIRKAMLEDPSFNAQMNGKTKYNLSYYLVPTEIWARCFELYCAKVLGVNNSLTPDTFGIDYPSTKIFIAQIKEYFEALLPSLSSLEDSIGDVAAST